MSNLADKIEVAKTATDTGGDAASALSIFDMVRRQEEAVTAALGSQAEATRFIRMMLTEMRRTPKLGQCAPETLLGAMMLAAQTRLEPGGPLGQAFLIPRWSGKRKCLEAQFQIGYKGLIQLAGRAGFLVQAHTVRQGDGFEFAYGTDEYVWHQPTADNEGAPVWWWAIGFPIGGGKAPFRVIDRNTADAARSAGKAGDSGPWVTHYDRMAEKTAIIRLTNQLPITTEVAHILAADGAVVHEAGTPIEAAADLVPQDDPADEPDEAEAPTDAGEAP